MTRTLAITIDADLETPVYVQIADQIRRHIVAGALAVGTPLPTVRALATDLGVNLNTVARSYRLLEEEGFVRIRHRSGVEVGAPATSAAPAVRGRLGEELAGLLSRMRQAGLSRDEIRTTALRQIEALSAQGARR